MMKARIYFIDEGLPDCSEKHAEDFVRKVFAADLQRKAGTTAD